VTFIQVMLSLMLVLNTFMMWLVYRSNPRRPPNRVFLPFASR